MKLVDSWGEPLDEGDAVAIQIGENLIGGTIARVNTGLGQPGTPESVPAVYVALLIPLHAIPNTPVVPGIVRRSQKKDTGIVSE